MDALVDLLTVTAPGSTALTVNAGAEVYAIAPVVVVSTTEIVEGSVWRGSWRGISRGER